MSNTNNLSYRSRLSTLEMDINRPPRAINMPMSFGWMSTYLYYILIVFILMIVLFVFTPSFLYVPKKKNKPQQKAWKRIILIWLIASVLLCGMVYFFIK